MKMAPTNHAAKKVEIEEEFPEFEPEKKYARKDGDVYNYVIVRTGDSHIAIDDNYLKTDFFPIRQLDVLEQHESGLYVLKKQDRLKHSGRSRGVDQWIIPVHLDLLFGNDDEPVDPHYILIKRSESDIEPIIEGLNGEPREQNLCIGLITTYKPFLEKFSDDPQDTMCKWTNDYFPAYAKKNITVDGKQDTVEYPVLRLEFALSDFTEEFCRKFPKLARMYPYVDKEHKLFKPYVAPEDRLF